MDHVEVLREGWQVVGDGHEIAHSDFGTDVALSLSGDFATNQERAQFAQALADRLNAAPAEAQPDREPADWPHQDWKGMDGATAWLLINRHASGWEAVGEMMDAWLSSNSEQPPSAPVGVEIRKAKDVSPHSDVVLVADLAQQPAAVDAEMVTRAVNAYDEATGEGWQMPCLQGMRAALTAALAGQQGGRSDD